MQRGANADNANGDMYGNTSYSNTNAITPNRPTNIVDFKGFDSNIILTLRGGILMSIGDFLQSLSQAMLVGVMLVGRLGVSSASLVPATSYNL